ncbi:MAG: 1,6-anhydro-N-acetylmuramyl-L-alanine amidase AmpD [Pseudomonadota bacterium]
MEIDFQTHLLTAARQLTSPHCNERPAGLPVDMVVIHGISLPPNEFGTGIVEKFFCGELPVSDELYYQEIKDLRVSAHLLISRLGKITQFVPFNRRAWHAGVSLFKGRDNCNDFSIGIELEGTDDLSYTEEQYKQLALVLKTLMTAYPAITRSRIVGHVDVAPGRKTDPGESFDWMRLDCLLEAGHNSGSQRGAPQEINLKEEDV